jgi:rhamnulokinase
MDTMRRHKDSAFEAADKILFIPDALSYMLTGEMVCEYSVASTGQIVNPGTRKLEPSILKAVGLTEANFGRFVYPGEEIGCLRPEVQKLTGLGPVPVIAVAGHDTASAVAAVPAENEKFAYLSSGTWSLMGIETPKPIINPDTRQLNFTNEGGIEGTTRFLKNITGMWLLERCRQVWKAEGREYSYDRIQEEAWKAKDFPSTVNPDDPRLANPENMVEVIRSLAAEQNQPVPQTDGEMISCIYHSLVAKYMEVIDILRRFAPFEIRKLHVIGGGSANGIVSQWTADALGMPVVCGPTEATAVGNVMVQARTAGLVKDLWEMREIIAKAFAVKTYLPGNKQSKP